MENDPLRIRHAHTILEGTVNVLPLKDAQHLGIIVSKDPWKVMIHFYYGVITDSKIGIQSYVARNESLKDSDLMELVKGLAEILSPEHNHIHPSSFIGYYEAAKKIVETTDGGVGHWLARSLMHLCEIFASMRDSSRERKLECAQRVVMYLRTTARLEVMMIIGRTSTLASAEKEMATGLACLLLEAYESTRTPDED